ncbi:MAG: peptidoglycan-binding protein [Alphaproteobacteria bacterium]|jgi:hypothetical protein|nr:peptidoglycan-binding protein [Alphaproteobacteria bacterium]
MQKSLTIAAVSGLALLAAACSSSSKEAEEANNLRIQNLESQLTDSRTQQQQYYSQFNAINQENARLKNQLTAMRRTPPPPARPVAAGPQTGAANLPPNARPGECYARVLIPAKYQAATERLLVEPESQRLETIPARYESGTERVLVREASERVEVIPAAYRTVTERVLVQPAQEVLTPVPATYRTVTERILVKQGYTTWKKGRGPIERLDQATGEIMCLVEVPPEYRTISKRVLDRPATTTRSVQPAVYKTVTRQVVDRPAATRRVAIPAQYDTVRVRKMVQPPASRAIAIPARYENITKRVKVSEERLEWRSILCETNTTTDIVSQIQRALRAAGHNPGRIDGVYGRQTKDAVARYQRSKGLPTGGLTMDTLRRLGVRHSAIRGA